MKDRTLLLSALFACCLHVGILFLNIGVTPPTLPSAVASIDVMLVGPPEAPPPPTEEVAPPEPLEEIEPEPEPIQEPEPIVEPVEEVEITEEPEIPVEPIPVPMEPVIEKPPTKEPAVQPSEPVTNITSVETTTAEITAESSSPTKYFEQTVDRKVSYTYNPKPTYPRVARRNGWEGKVLLLVEALQSGRVGKIEVEKSCGYDILDKAAVKAVRKWRFTPAERAGRPVRTWVRIPIEFNLRTSK